MIIFSCFGISNSQIAYTEESGWESFGEVRASDETTGAILNMTAEDFADVIVPIGGGISLLAAMCAGYFSIKKRMKSNIMMFLVCSVILFTGCNKDNIESDFVNVKFTPREEHRTSITEAGHVEFTANDILYMYASGVGNVSGRYLGKLTNGNNVGASVQFTGTVKKWHENETLCFYYLGQNTVNSDGTAIIDFSDQTYSNKPVTIANDLDNIAKYFHIGLCKITAPDECVTTIFNGKLRNMMALGVFDTHEFAESSYVKILSNSGLNNLVKINADGSIEYGVAGINSDQNVDNQSGHITIGTGTDKKYVSLLPQSDILPANVSLVFISNNKIGTYNLDLEIKPNSFFHNGNDGQTANGILIPASDYSSNAYIDFPSPSECMNNPHLFTLFSDAATTKKVVFSQGNLVYDKGRFKQHKNPWGVCSIDGNSDIFVNSTFDVFGWAASGYNYGQHIYQPYSNSTTQYSGSIGYGYGAAYQGYKQSFHPHAQYRRSDYGWYQFGMHCFDEYTITPGNNSYWRSLGQAEWTYLFNSRITSSSNLIDYHTGNQVSNARFVKVTLNGQKGIFIFPDTYSHPQSVQLRRINVGTNEGFTENTLSTGDYNAMHGEGAEFLPINGYYDKVTEEFTETDNGYYWSCKTQKTDQAIICKITGKESSSIYTTHINKYQGLYVRLVFQVEGNVY